MGLKERIQAEHNGEPVAAAEDVHLSFFRRRLLEEVDLSELATLNPTQRRARLERVVGHLLTREGPVMSNAERTALIRQIVDASLGLGVLEPLLADETCLLYTSPSPRDVEESRMPSSA